MIFDRLKSWTAWVNEILKKVVGPAESTTGKSFFIDKRSELAVP